MSDRRITLQLEPLVEPGFLVRRSGFRWRCEEGEHVPAGAPLATCYLAYAALPGTAPRTRPLADEAPDFHVALVTPVAGRVHRRPELIAHGGWVDQLGYFDWDAVPIVELVPDDPGVPGPLRCQLLFLAARRVAGSAESRSGLLAGWYDRARAWWGAAASRRTLLGLGSGLERVLRGEQHPFLELFHALPGGGHVVHAPDDPLVPSSIALLSALGRTHADAVDIARDVERWLAGSDGSASPEGDGRWPLASAWVAIALAVQGLTRTCPVLERYEVVLPAGTTVVEPAQVVVLDREAEDEPSFRHRRLGYVLTLRRAQLPGLPSPFHAWLAAEFAPVTPHGDEPGRLAKLVRERTGARVEVVGPGASPADLARLLSE